MLTADKQLPALRPMQFTQQPTAVCRPNQEAAFKATREESLHENPD
jgi:hypothetical protein